MHKNKETNKYVKIYMACIALKLANYCFMNIAISVLKILDKIMSN